MAKQTDDAKKIEAYHAARAKDAEFVINEPNPLPGEILDREAYEKALESGSLTEIKAALGDFYDEQTKPNLAFIGYRSKREPVTSLNDGMDTIKLPKDQAKPFYHKDAVRIIQILPELYKPVTDK